MSSLEYFSCLIYYQDHTHQRSNGHIRRVHARYQRLHLFRTAALDGIRCFSDPCQKFCQMTKIRISFFVNYIYIYIQMYVTRKAIHKRYEYRCMSQMQVKQTEAPQLLLPYLVYFRNFAENFLISTDHHLVFQIKNERE